MEGGIKEKEKGGKTMEEEEGQKTPVVKAHKMTKIRKQQELV